MYPVPRLITVAAALSIFAFGDAHAQTDLLAGSKARIRSVPTGNHRISARFRDVTFLGAPDCSAAMSVRVITSSGDSTDLALDCSNWQSLALGKFRYRAPAADGLAVSKITYGQQRLFVKLRGTTTPLLTGGESFVEIRFAVDGDRRKYCGRFASLSKNSDRTLASHGPSAPCPAFEAERAFWDTLNLVDDREAEAVARFEQAVADVPTDGRAWFLKGMFHMYRQSQTLDYDNPTQFVLDEVDLAEAALAEAVPLLPDDTRIPGFLGSATYVGGITHNDAARVQLALDRMRDSIILYPLFNVFNFVGTVGIHVDNHDPLFSEAIGYVDVGLASGCSPFTDPEVCGNVGRAPHNVEGSMLLFGDLYAKAGDAAAAAAAYQLGITFDDLDTIPYIWRTELDDRIANLAARIALYQDADPNNDPLIIGEGNYENCLFCHGR